MQKFDAVVKAKTFGDLLKHFNDVETSLMIQRDDLLGVAPTFCGFRTFR